MSGLSTRELYLPKSWTGDPERCAAAGMPADVTFATKPQLAARLPGGPGSDCPRATALRDAPMPFHLETERLRLQPWTESDADELRVLHSERGTGTPTVERAREVIVKQLAATATSGIAYELLQRAHGRGYATEAAGAVLDAAIATGRKRLWPTVGTPNTSSFRVLEKLGFERDHVSADDHGEFVWLTRALP